MLIEREKFFGKLEFVTSRELQQHCNLHGKYNILLKVVLDEKPSFLSWVETRQEAWPVVKNSLKKCCHLGCHVIFSSMLEVLHQTRVGHSVNPLRSRMRFPLLLHFPRVLDWCTSRP